MLRDDDVVLIISNAPDLLLAKRIAHVLVEDGLAACVNLGAPGLSIYMWQGEVEGAEEVPIHIKTTYARHAAVVAALAQMHPYDVPEIIVLPVIGGAAPYLDWVREQTAVVQNKRLMLQFAGMAGGRALRPSRTDLARRLFALLALALLWLGWNATSRAEAEFLDPEKAFVFSAAMSAPDSVELRYRVAPGYYMYRERFGITISPYGAATLGEAVYPERGEVRPTFEGHGGLPPGRDRARAGATRRPGLHADGHLARLRRRWPVLSADGPQREADPRAGRLRRRGRRAGRRRRGGIGRRIRRRPGRPAERGRHRAGRRAGRTGLGQDRRRVPGAGPAAGLHALRAADDPDPVVHRGGRRGPGAKPARGRGLGLAATYVLGMSVVYTALGVTAGLSGAGLAAWLQTPWILSLFAALLAVLALAMFDVFTFQMPSGIQARLSGARRAFQADATPARC